MPKKFPKIPQGVTAASVIFGVATVYNLHQNNETAKTMNSMKDTNDELTANNCKLVDSNNKLIDENKKLQNENKSLKDENTSLKEHNTENKSSKSTEDLIENSIFNDIEYI